MKKITISILFTSALFISAFSQTKTINNVLRSKAKNFSPIITNGIVKGYSMFYELDKIDKKHKSYRITFFDNSLNEIGSSDFIESKKMYYVSSTFNGKSIMIQFYDAKTKQVILRKFSTSAEELSRDTRLVESKTELMTLNALIRSQQEETTPTIQPIMNKGFVNYGYSMNSKYAYEMRYLPENGEDKKWKIEAPSKTKGLEMAGFLCEADGTLINLITKKPSLMSKKMETYIQAVNTKNGNVLFEVKTETDKYNLMPSNASLNTENGNIELYGMYFGKEDKAMKKNSLGFASITYNSKGEIVSESYNSWAGDVSKFLPVGKKNKVEGGFFVYIHKIIKDESGNIFVVGEQYRKSASALGIASKMLGDGSGSVAKIVIEDMMMFKMDKDFKLVDVKVIDKAKENVQLEAGAATVSTILLGHMLKGYGHFDYAFSQKNSSTGDITVLYIDGEKKGLALGVISMVDGEISNTKTVTEYGKKSYSIKNAKPGSILMYDYIRKEKTVNLRIEKLNY